MSDAVSPLILSDWTDLPGKGTLLQALITEEQWTAGAETWPHAKSILAGGEHLKVLHSELARNGFKHCLTGAPIERTVLFILVEGHFGLDAFTSSRTIELLESS